MKVLLFISLLALGVSGTAAATPTASHSKHKAHRSAHHRPAHKHTGIGPGGDLDGDNHGGSTDGDGNI
jgi:hypothetical protein